MFSPITYPTAKEFWLKNDINDSLTPITSRQINHADTTESQLLDFSSRHHLKLPVHIMVPDASSRHSFGSAIHAHIIPKGIAKMSFIEDEDSIFIVCPELCFLLAAKELTIPELAVFATNLCAMYKINPSEALGQAPRIPITNIEKMKQYLEMSRNVAGIKNARMAIQYALDNSNSPMESRVAILFILPFYHGGYALLRPVLNYNVTLSADGKKTLGRDFCCCDMVWPEQKVVVEYDSNLVHLNKAQFNYDKRKAAALQLSGYTVINVTHENLKNFRAIEALGYLMRKVLHMWPMTDRLEKYRDKRQRTIPFILKA